MAKKNRKSITARLAAQRVWIQAALLIAWLDPMAVRMHSVCSPVFHCYSCPLATFACPIGVLANFSAIHVIPFIAIGTLIAFGALFGSIVCGWACPFGFLQDLIGRIPVPKLTLPAWTGYGRYVVLLVLVLWIPYTYGQDHPAFFCSLCPAGALEAALPYTASTAIAGEGLAFPSALKMAILSTILIAAFFTWRPWCNLFCPLGAIYGLCDHFSFLYLRFEPSRCKECDICRRTCRYGGLSGSRKANQRCVRCLDCTACGAISLSCGLERAEKIGQGADQPQE